MNPSRLILLCHPDTFDSASMPRYARMIGQGMIERGFAVEYWTAPGWLVRFGRKASTFRKWLRYIDAYVIFPLILRRKLRNLGPESLVVVTDHALGIWVPAIASRPHVIHCHDFLAQRSALGEFPEHRTGPTGKIYQKLIRRGFRRGRNFISVSQKTQQDLGRFLTSRPELSTVVYNGLNYPFAPLPAGSACQRLAPFQAIDWKGGFFLHVGGNQWYKNRPGVIDIYREYLKTSASPLPLVMIGAPPGRDLEELTSGLPAHGRVHFLCDLEDSQVHAAYCLATALIFPSLEEGFGWPIIEAQASGCPVITTKTPPMTEVGGDAAWYLDRRECRDRVSDEQWARRGGQLLEKISSLPPAERNLLVAAGISQAAKFSTASSLDQIASVYRSIPATPRAD